MDEYSEKRICQSCAKDFTIEPEDFRYYEKMKVPAPTWCPSCRLERRLIFNNAWNMYWRNCDRCGQKTLSIYRQDQKIIVYCPTCWWGDSWDGTEYGIDYDPSVPFFEQMKNLIERTPFMSQDNTLSTLKNSNYCNGIAWCRDSYLTIWADYCDTVYYSSILNGLRFSADCLRATVSELCYESIGIHKCYRTFFSEECESCVDVYFCRNCYGCINCIGCVNMRGATNCIFNTKYTREEYLEKIKEFKINTWSGLQKIKKLADSFWRIKPYRQYSGHTLNYNITGEYVFESKNSKNLYICEGVEDSKYTQFVTVKTAKDCMDYSGWGNNSSQVYESVVVGENVNSICFSLFCWPDNVNLQYCYYNIAGKNNFGCVNLKRKNYCILNKQYSKEEYEKLKNRIIEDMKKNPYIDKLGRKYYYGEFLPPEFSKFPYNKSNAMFFCPKTKEEVLQKGYSWMEEEKQGCITSMKADALPETIEEVNNSIFNETIECRTCSRAYRITKGEVDLLYKMNLPLPHECLKCRQDRRFARLNFPTFYNRNCGKCQKQMVTAFSPEKPEIIYCEKCYQEEFL